MQRYKLMYKDTILHVHRTIYLYIYIKKKLNRRIYIKSPHWNRIYTCTCTCFALSLVSHNSRFASGTATATPIVACYLFFYLSWYIQLETKSFVNVSPCIATIIHFHYEYDFFSLQVSFVAVCMSMHNRFLSMLVCEKKEVKWLCEIKGCLLISLPLQLTYSFSLVHKAKEYKNSTAYRLRKW